MSTRTRLLPLVLLLWLLSGAEPRAWFGDGWLEKLSGPGPFRGWSVDTRLVCIAGPARPDEPTAILTGPDEPIGWKATFPKDPNRRVWVTPLGCHFLDRDRARLELGWQYAWMSADAGDNPLDYSHRPSVAPADRAIDLRVWTITADLRLHRALDVGTAFGRSTFSSPAGVFGDLRKSSFQPVRVTFRPLSFLAKDRRLAELISMRVEATKFNGGFTADEFGARPGSFSEPGELVWGFRVLVDPGTLFWLR